VASKDVLIFFYHSLFSFRMSALLQGKEEIDEFYAERFKEEEGDEGFNPESGILSYLISSSGD